MVMECHAFFHSTVVGVGTLGVIVSAGGDSRHLLEQCKGTRGLGYLGGQSQRHNLCRGFE